MTHCCVLLHGVQMHSSSSSQIQNALLLKPAAHGVIKAECDSCYPYKYSTESTNIDAGRCTEILKNIPVPYHMIRDNIAEMEF